MKIYKPGLPKKDMIGESLQAANLAYNSALQAIATQIGISLQVLVVIMGLVSLWAIVWKGIALWKASQKKQIAWFVVMLIVNTMGILEILYIFVFSKMGMKTAQSASSKKKR